MHPFHGRELPPQYVDSRVEMAAVQVTPLLRSQLAMKELGHGLGPEHGEGGAGLDAHVHAAVLAELVAHVGQRLQGIEIRHGAPRGWGKSEPAFLSK
jgi:hypothetical protein